LRPPSCGGGGFVYVGNLRPHKGVDILVKAHAAMVDQSTGPALHIVTSADDQQIRRLREPYGMDTARWLCVHQQCSDEERDAILHYAIACVAPSLEEGYGYCIDEADAVGTPTIASLIPPHLENGAGRKVTFTPPGDVAALRAALRSTLRAGGIQASRIAEAQAEQLRGRTDASTVILGLMSSSSGDSS
jgi:glycosyltransferase involved in cell wall biosynthesis